MPNFSALSETRLRECHEDIQTIMSAAIEEGIDFSIVCGYRGEAEQNSAFDSGNSKLKFPESKHNKTPSLAVDIAPYYDGKIQWNDLDRFKLLAMFVMGIARAFYLEGRISHKLRWGGDWDRDFDFDDQTFNDLCHFELMEE